MSAQRKPHDLGNGVVCASFGVEGSWLSLTTTHPELGVVELSGAPAFPPERDGHVDEVRAHRAHLTDPGTAMLRLVGVRPGPDGDPPGWRVRSSARADETAPRVEQRYVLTADTPGTLLLEFRGRLDRPAYAEITPGGPIPPQLPEQVVELDGSTLRVRAPAGGAEPEVRIEVTGPGLALGGWRRTEQGASLRVAWDEPLHDVPLTIAATMTCGDPAPSPRPVGWSAAVPMVAPTELASAGLAGITTAAVRYTLGCTAFEVAEGECSILTDHRLLPLSWTRDAYYQAALLLAVSPELPEAAAVVERHLAWLWRSSRDKGGVWRRSHLSTGEVKDTGYQVDQQLFPLLELVDFRRTTGRWPELLDAAGWGAEVRRVWAGLPRDGNGLVPGEENPADDPSELPYLLSSQLLLVYVTRRLAEFEGELGLLDLGLRRDAARTLEVLRATFTCPGPYGEQWAYEADGAGRHRLYHDANDVPTALAPLWGLCDVEDPKWRATMRFAFSAHNPGFVAGALRGLGSAHTPGIWPLGDAQEWAVAVAQGDEERAAEVRTRLTEVASADGTLPETYDEQTGEWLARHWFAWPGSLVGLLHVTLDERRGPWVATYH